VRLKIAGSEINIFAEDYDFANEANERLSCTYEGEDIEIGFNARYLSEMLSVLDTAEVRMEFSHPSRAGLLLPVENEKDQDILMLIMPMMLNNN
jgi:DNA polymerase-3 subunit beta